MKAWLEDHGKDFGLFIDGKWVKPDGRKKYLTKNPATGKALKLNSVLKGENSYNVLKGENSYSVLLCIFIKSNAKCYFTNQDVTRTQYNFLHIISLKSTYTIIHYHIMCINTLNRNWRFLSHRCLCFTFSTIFSDSGDFFRGGIGMDHPGRKG